LLIEAGKETDKIRRLALVIAFCVAQYAGIEARISKPFNPILGETYELLGPDFKYFSEQVSHHPPISAAYAESDFYKFWMNTSMKQKFKGNSLEFTPLGCMNFQFGDDHIVVSRPVTSCQNIILGGMHIDTQGKMEAKNLTTGDSC